MEIKRDIYLNKLISKKQQRPGQGCHRRPQMREVLSAFQSVQESPGRRACCG